jgi:hypothetical protein
MFPYTKAVVHLTSIALPSFISFIAKDQANEVPDAIRLEAKTMSHRIMRPSVLGMLTSPRLERWRAKFPYALFTGLAAYMYMIPVALLVLFAQALGYRGEGNITLTRTWLTILLAPAGIAALIALLATVGWLSGYRPFRREWRNVPLAEAVEMAGRLRAQAEAHGFVAMWNGGADGFVSTWGMGLERTSYFNTGKSFPMRLSLFIRRVKADRAKVSIKLALRTVVLWDSGERATCEQVAQSLIQAATENPANPASV